MQLEISRAMSCIVAMNTEIHFLSTDLPGGCHNRTSVWRQLKIVSQEGPPLHRFLEPIMTLQM